MWSNGFLLTLELRSLQRRPWRRRRSRGLAGAVSQACGSWRLTLRDGRRVDAELERGWMVGNRAGLRWRVPDGRTYVLFLAAGDVSDDAWRRLRVRLRHPLASRRIQAPLRSIQT